jgi:hypothetical protein
MLAPAARHAAMIEEKPAAFPASIPLYDMERVPDMAALFRHTKALALKGNIKRVAPKAGRPRKEEKTFAPVGWISIPGMPQCDGAVRVAGEGMNPAIGNGDIVIYKQLDHVSEIFWGELYLLALETAAGEYVAVRYLRRSENENMAVLAGENPAFADTEVELSKIRAIAFVKASIRMNSSK